MEGKVPQEKRKKRTSLPTLLRFPAFKKSQSVCQK